MPRIVANAGPRILQRLELQPLNWKPDFDSHAEKPLPVSGDKMRHRATPPDMTVQPEASRHGMHHPVATALKLTPRGIVRPVRLGNAY